MKALATMIWKCRSKGNPAIVCHVGDAANHPRTKEFRHDGVTEKVTTAKCWSYEKVEEEVRQVVTEYMKKEGPGVVLLTYSALLTRGIEKVGRKKEEESE